MGGNHSRQKGHNYERAKALVLREFFPDCRRQLEYHSSDANGVDLMNTGEWRIQIKRLAKYASINKIKEIKIPGKKLLITKADNEPDVYCLYEEDFIGLLRDNKFLKEQLEKMKHLVTSIISKDTPQ